MSTSVFKGIKYNMQISNLKQVLDILTDQNMGDDFIVCEHDALYLIDKEDFDKFPESIQQELEELGCQIDTDIDRIYVNA